MALLKAREAVMAGFRPDLEAHDLTEQQWRALRILTEQPGITMGDLAEGPRRCDPACRYRGAAGGTGADRAGAGGGTPPGPAR
jgi:hypothetical protein